MYGTHTRTHARVEVSAPARSPAGVQPAGVCKLKNSGTFSTTRELEEYAQSEARPIDLAQGRQRSGGVGLRAQAGSGTAWSCAVGSVFHVLWG